MKIQTTCHATDVEYSLRLATDVEFSFCLATCIAAADVKLFSCLATGVVGNLLVSSSLPRSLPFLGPFLQVINFTETFHPYCIYNVQHTSICTKHNTMFYNYYY